MTNLKEPPKKQSTPATAPINVNGKNHLAQGNGKKPETKPTSPPSQNKGMRLWIRLLLSVVPTVVVPLAVAAVSGWWVVHEDIENRYRERLASQPQLAAKGMKEVIAKFLPIPESLSVNPVVLDATRRGSEKVAAERLNYQPLPEIEQQFDELRVVEFDRVLTNYLKQLAQVNGLSEVIITEQHGFNVAYSKRSSDFVQKDELWWQEGKRRGIWMGELEYDDSTGTRQIPLTYGLEDPNTGEFLGVVKIGIPSSAFEVIETYLSHSGILPTGDSQVLNAATNQVLVTVNEEGVITGSEITGGEAIETFAKTMVENSEQESWVLLEKLEAASATYGFKDLQAIAHTHGSDGKARDVPLSELANQERGHEHEEHEHYTEGEEDEFLRASFSYQGRYYRMVTVPETKWVAISSVDEQVLQGAGSELIGVFALVGGILAFVATGVVLLIARQLSSPLTNVSEAALMAAAGNLSARAEPQGSYETQVLAESYNNLVERVEQLLKEQEATAEQQRKQREELEAEVLNLMNDIEQAADGDLTVRAQLMEGDIGIVADLFNAVVENLQETAQQVKVAASRVSESLGENEVEIRGVAEGAIAEAEQIQATLNSLEAMTDSIQEVADNAQKAATIADTAFTTAQAGNQAMDQTVESIQGLRLTVGETAKKMKHLGESAQKISQVVSLIDEISLKTSLLAINASVEANRAGELGQGFTAVAEQVESLAEQSASAAKEIAQIVTNIQSETQEAIETMEQGTTEVVESTRSVEQTKARLADVVARSEEINNLMQSISHSTVSQAETSQAVSRLMEQVAQSSQERSETSKEVAEAIQETAQVAKRLEASVEQFKVEQ